MWRAYTIQWRHNGRDCVSNHQPNDCLLKRLFRRRSKKTSKLRFTGLCERNSPGTDEFPAQMASNAENVSIWWRHHEYSVSHFVHHRLVIIRNRTLSWFSINCKIGIAAQMQHTHTNTHTHRMDLTLLVPYVEHVHYLSVQLVSERAWWSTPPNSVYGVPPRIENIPRLFKTRWDIRP